jgi:hypothetical protein
MNGCGASVIQPTCARWAFCARAASGHAAAAHAQKRDELAPLHVGPEEDASRQLSLALCNRQRVRIATHSLQKPIGPDVADGSIATKLNCLRHVRSTPNSYQIADITVRQLRARSGSRRLAPPTGLFAWRDQSRDLLVALNRCTSLASTEQGKIRPDPERLRH